MIIKEELIMSIKTLKQYVELCEQFNIEPTLSGINRFKQALPIINELSKEDLKSILFDIVSLL